MTSPTLIGTMMNKYLYLIYLNKHNLFKIGVTTNTKRRLNEISKNFNSNITILNIIECVNAYKIEGLLHSKFRPYKVNIEYKDYQSLKKCNPRLRVSKECYLPLLEIKNYFEKLQSD